MAPWLKASKVVRLVAASVPRAPERRATSSESSRRGPNRPHHHPQPGMKAGGTATPSSSPSVTADGRLPDRRRRATGSSTPRLTPPGSPLASGGSSRSISCSATARPAEGVRRRRPIAWRWSSSPRSRPYAHHHAERFLSRRKTALRHAGQDANRSTRTAIRRCGATARDLRALASPRSSPSIPLDPFELSLDKVTDHFGTQLDFTFRSPVVTKLRASVHGGPSSLTRVSWLTVRVLSPGTADAPIQHMSVRPVWTRRSASGVAEGRRADDLASASSSTPR